MTLPPGFLDELRTRLSLSQVVGRKVTWDTRKSNQGKGDLWAACPFHQEKTASFHVDDRRGFYHCFGCQAKGDAISFVRETENVGFMEAVEILAREAGLAMPERDPAAQHKADRRTELAAVMEDAVRHFRLQLRTGAGAAARAYLDGRGLSDAACDRWEIGFAPPGWDGLRTALTGKGIAVQALLDCGLVRPSDKGRQPYDTFRGRIMYPIRDASGRCIAFGGRAMDPADNAKYLNSPDTPLFDKSRTLYNIRPAREAAGKGQPLVVAEGYMDVIALGEAGITAAVAPLGTAVTEHQLRMMWRIHPEPVIALDGDAAGMRAAMRVIDTALPLLEAGQSLRFALLPEGQDPDDLLRARGPAAMRALVEAAEPMVQLLWRRETAGKVFDSPERRAALDRALQTAIGAIRDPSIRSHYGAAVKSLQWEYFSQARRTGGRTGLRTDGTGNTRGGWPRSEPVRGSTRASLLAGDGADGMALREAAILAVILATPAVLIDYEGEVERLECRDPRHRAIRDAILRCGAAQDLRAEVAVDVGEEAVAALLSLAHVAIHPAVRRPGDAELARMSLAETFARLAGDRGHSREIADGIADLEGFADERLTFRIDSANRAREAAMTGPEVSDGDFIVAPNGARVRREDQKDFASILSAIAFDKPGDKQRRG